ncbi:MAG: TIGR03905 family TSCPD domain-containing protein [Lachnospiraceae bacterium]|nr:TIGR03905 family TSCPD domain-containing protein [Lachnospiraceae bacterium]
MKNYEFVPKGVCAQKIRFSLDGNIIHDVSFEKGCNGNLKAISKLVEGRDASEIASILEGNLCGMKGTSCADQFSKALNEALATQAD